jgi:two-component system, cell cycle sensor histidine kinase and response regulator CckA
MTRALIVDDHTENLYYLRTLFEAKGYEVDEARHGAEALGKARQKRPDLIISDLLMPVMDGYTLLRRWKDDDKLKDIPFVVYTATYTDPKDERLAMDLGADAFIIKPAEPGVFMAFIQKVLEGGRPPVRRAGESPAEQSALLREYNQTLIRKLEKKASELTQANNELLEEIAERKHTETALRDSETRYHTIFDVIADPLFVYDRETLRYLDVNKAAIAVYGYSREEFLQMTIKDIRPKEDVPALIKMLALTGAKMENRGIWRHQKKNGEIMEMEISAYGFDCSGRPACVVQARDVTEKQRAAAEAARTAELLQAVANGTPDAVFIKDRSGKYLLFNEAAVRHVGKPVKEVLGKDDTAIFNAEDARKIMTDDQRVMKLNQNQTVEELLVTVRGPRMFQAIKVPYRDAQGNVIGIIGISRDVTDLKKAEEDLRLRNRAMEAVSQGILITDPNLPDNPIIYASAGFERMTGYRAEEVEGRNCRFLQGKDTNPEAIAELRAALAERRSCQVELLNYRKEGTPFWNQLAISPVFGPLGELTHFVGVQTDVTERRKLEDQLRQSQKMEAFGQLAGGVAHDFNNLVTVISGYSDMILSKALPGDPYRESIHAIHEAGETAAALTRQLLAFSRQTVLSPKVLNLNNIVDEMQKMLRRLIGEDISLTTVLKSDVNLVKVDPGHLEQVLMNLAVNARDAMPKGGKLTIETANVLLDKHYAQTHSGVMPGEYVMLAVSDTGVGIPKEVQPRIFEPFFTTKDVGRGTGLGLAVVDGIIKQSGGDIKVYSEVGVGTTFKIYFPAVKDKAVQKNQQDENPAGRGTETVLIVEDDEAVRGLAVYILEQKGYKVLTAGDGSEALKAAEKQGDKIALLISDVVMPGMGGSELAQIMRGRLPKIKVLFLSGYTDDAIVRHGILQEKAAFLQKPFSPVALAKKVREVLDA